MGAEALLTHTPAGPKGKSHVGHEAMHAAQCENGVHANDEHALEGKGLAAALRSSVGGAWGTPNTLGALLTCTWSHVSMPRAHRTAEKLPVRMNSPGNVP